MGRAVTLLGSGLGLGLLLLVGGLAQAASYKWVDEQGEVHYSQTPPPSGDYTVIGDPPRPDVTPEQAAAELRAKEAAFAERRTATQEAADERARQAAAATARARDCETARANLAQYTANPRILFTDASGQVIRLPEEQRQAKISEAQAQIEKYCR